MADSLLGQQPREVLALFHAGGAHKDRLPGLVSFGNVLDDSVELGDLVLVDQIRLVHTNRRTVGGDFHDTELVGAHELGGFGLRGTGHARDLLVHAEVVLQRDRGQGLVLGLDLHPFLGLDGLVHTLGIAAPRQCAAGVLVNDHDLAVDHHVVLVLLEQFLGLDGVVQKADQRRVGRLVEIVDAQVVLDLFDPGLQHTDGALLLVHLVVGVAFQRAHHLRELGVPAVHIPGSLPGNDQRGTGLVDEDRVDFVDDHEVVVALDQFLFAPRHVVTQVVETELVVRPIRDIGLVLLAPCGRIHIGHDATGAHPQESEDTAHQVRLVFRQEVIDRDHVHALAGQRVEIGRGRGNQGLTFTGTHFRDISQVQCGATHHLHVEVTHTQHPVCSFTHSGKSFWEQRIQGFPFGIPRPELLGFPAKFLVGHIAKFALQRIDCVRVDPEFFQDLLVAGTQNTF